MVSHSQEPHSSVSPFVQLNCARLLHLLFQLSILFFTFLDRENQYINRTRNVKSLADVLEEAEMFIVTDFFNGFTETVLFASEEGLGKSEHD